jgi:hypothetical protein
MPTGTRTPEPAVGSDRKQLNVRLDPESEKLLAELLPGMSRLKELNLSQSDLFRLALRALKREYDAAMKAKGKR